MSKSFEPKTYQTPRSVISKWDKINRNPDELSNKAGPGVIATTTRTRARYPDINKYVHKRDRRESD
jgi:hypothetical protein